MTKFVMRKMAAGMNQSKGNLYPRMKSTGTVGLEELAYLISHGTTFTPGDIKGVVSALVQEMAWQMAQGKSVQIEGLGRFRARLKIDDRAEDERDDGTTTRRTGKSVQVGGVNFIADPDLTRETDRHADLERQMPRNGGKPVIETLEERVQVAVDYLRSNYFMTVGAYAHRTGLNSTAATRELNSLAADPSSPIGTRGYRSHKVYVLKSEQEQPG